MTNKNFFENISDHAKNTLWYPFLPKYEKDRLNSYIKPISYESAEALTKEIPWVTNYIFEVNWKKLKEIFDAWVIITPTDADDLKEFEEAIESKEKLVLWTTDLKLWKFLVERYAKDEERLHSANIIVIDFEI